MGHPRLNSYVLLGFWKIPPSQNRLYLTSGWWYYHQSCFLPCIRVQAITQNCFQVDSMSGFCCTVYNCLRGFFMPWPWRGRSRSLNIWELIIPNKDYYSRKVHPDWRKRNFNIEQFLEIIFCDLWPWPLTQGHWWCTHWCGIIVSIYPDNLKQIGSPKQKI